MSAPFAPRLDERALGLVEAVPGPDQRARIGPAGRQTFNRGAHVSAARADHPQLVDDDGGQVDRARVGEGRLERQGPARAGQGERQGQPRRAPAGLDHEGAAVGLGIDLGLEQGLARLAGVLAKQRELVGVATDEPHAQPRAVEGEGDEQAEL
ncbi:hypothetical protein PPSIR1_13660, partial [Plesiocystis pacifica SIR-1]